MSSNNGSSLDAVIEMKDKKSRQSNDRESESNSTGGRRSRQGSASNNPHRRRSSFAQRLSLMLQGGKIPISAIQDKIVENNFSGAYADSVLDYNELLDLLPDTPMPAIHSTEDIPSTTHLRLREFLTKEFDLTLYGIKPGDRVGVCLPNGPNAAVCLLATTMYCCCAPINANLSPDEVEFELTNLGAKIVIVPEPGFPDSLPQKTIDKLTEMKIPIIILKASTTEAGLFKLEGPQLPEGQRTIRGVANSKTDIALVLHTSGTSGKKKIVPYPLNNIVVGASVILSSWALSPFDVNMNMMPLFHIGGIARNLYSPILSGGSAVFCKGFDAGLFWDILEKTGATWYYAAPTMHHMILQEYKSRDFQEYDHKIRMIANAAGGLLPALAEELRETFKPHCVVLPSYGMTECMPISAPPVDYKLDRPGTSGLAVGPELAILDGYGNELSVGSLGNICVRGPPLMPGYENNEKANKESFFASGFFNTGDMGYMDEDGYLYITGRSKEVINRGGEIISPFDVEEAVIKHPRVKDCLCFSAPHDVLQETIGVVVVPEPGKPRVDLKELQKYVAKTLHPSKWPQVIVYMDQTPKNQTGKPLRIQLGQRFDLEDLEDTIPLRERLWEATAPPKSASLQTKIPIERVLLDFGHTERAMRDHEAVKDAFLALPGGPAGQDGQVLAYIAPANIDLTVLHQQISTEIDDFLLPDKVILVDEIPYKTSGRINEEELARMKKAMAGGKGDAPKTPLQEELHRIFQQVLNISDPISLNDDFFEIGGDSMKAGSLNSLIRKRCNATIPVNTLYTAGTIEELSAVIQKVKDEKEAKKANPHKDKAGDPYSIIDDEQPVKNYSYMMPWTLFWQIVPLAIFYPVIRMTAFYIFMNIIVGLNGHLKELDNSYDNILRRLVIALLVALFYLKFIVPFFGIAFKWIVIGRFKEGRYPLWGQYYIRWWLTKQFLEVCGRGFFTWVPSLLPTYYWLLGCDIGSNVKINLHATISEYDLVKIGNNCVIDHVQLRGMALDKGNMILRKTTIYNSCSICCKTAIAPGSTLEPGTCLGPASSSYEKADASNIYRDFNRNGFPPPNAVLLWFCGYPILICVWVAALLPRLAMLCVLVYEFNLENSSKDFRNFLHWFGSYDRMGYYMGVKAVREVISPLVHLCAVIIVKKCFIGKFNPGHRHEWGKFQYWLMKMLVTGGTFGGAINVIGTHYELVSMVYRAMGAKIGKGVYWPGSGVDVVEFDQLTVEDNVIFGSRSVILVGDANEVRPVTICEGAMLADRCVLLPGTTLGRGAVLGSGGIGPKNFQFPPGSTWVGSKAGKAELFSQGDEQEAMTKDMTTPFNRAFYLSKKFPTEYKIPYYVMPLWMHVCMNVLVLAISAAYWVIPLVFAFRLVSYIDIHTLNQTFLDRELLGLLICTYAPMTLCFSFLSLLLCIGAKWLVIGRRKPGLYKWDEASYCQRWQIYLVLENLRRGCLGGSGVLDFLTGSAFMSWYFTALGAKIGKNCCLYPNGGDPLMTEPECVDMGDNVCVDDASLIAHINTRGEFQLNPLKVESGCVLRSASRLLSGGSMEKRSMLLEHTLIMAGDTTDRNSIWQGWPGELIKLMNFEEDDTTVNYSNANNNLKVGLLA